MTPPTRSTAIRRSPRRGGKALVERTAAGKHKKSTPARKSLNGKSSGSQDNKGVAEGASAITEVGTVVRKRIVSSTAPKKKRKSVQPRRAPPIFVPSESESSYTDNNAEEDNDDDDSEKIADNGDGNGGEAVQETSDDEGGGEGNYKGDESSSDNNASETSSNGKKQRRLSPTKEDRNGDELTRTGHAASAAVQSTGRNAGVVETNQPNLSAAGRAPIMNLNAPMQIRGMSKTESLKNQQPHVAQRVRAFVKAELFRKIKFVNNDAMFQQAITWVMDQEHVARQQRGSFQMVYESTFNDALNQKRSSCEQAGGEIVRATIALFKESGKELFTMEELCKLRRSGTEREKEAFFWFFGTFLESVCGRRNWGRQKRFELVSEATVKGGRAKMVTKSDEAFALLLYENYIDKWAATPTLADVDDDDDLNDRILGDGEPEAPVRGKKKQPRLRGRYTRKKNGHCKYGGWSSEGISRFNYLYKLVQEDRACPQAAAMERELLASFRNRGGGIGNADGEDDQGTAIAGTAALEASFVEAAWDLDD